ncbi:MAG: hypothetical protein M2R46_04684 [Verrucomicrobia subdivision 3 bacterium]|nr:hypothetical protein [Limisphaerales bacterium]
MVAGCGVVFAVGEFGEAMEILRGKGIAFVAGLFVAGVLLLSHQMPRWVEGLLSWLGLGSPKSGVSGWASEERVSKFPRLLLF